MKKIHNREILIRKKVIYNRDVIHHLQLQNLYNLLSKQPTQEGKDQEEDKRSSQLLLRLKGLFLQLCKNYLINKKILSINIKPSKNIYLLHKINKIEKIRANSSKIIQ